MPQAAEDTVLQRLARLERVVSRWRIIGFAAMALLGLVVLLGAFTRGGRTAIGDVLAREVILVDRAQAPRASLALGNDDGPSLLLMDQQKKVRVGLTVLGDGRPSLGMMDAQGQSRVVLALDAQGVPTLRFLDAHGHVIWSTP
jgi:hypothetical protein